MSPPVSAAQHQPRDGTEGGAQPAAGPRPTAHPPGPGAPLPDAAALALRSVHRAASDLRRGTPVLLRGAVAGEALLLAAAETVGARGIAELVALAAEPPVLLLAPARAAALAAPPAAAASGLRRLQEGPVRRLLEGAPVALGLPPALLEPAALRGFADPTAALLLPENGSATGLSATPPPALAPAAIALAKLARLLPAVIAAPLREADLAGAGQSALLAVEAEAILGYPGDAAATLRRAAEAAVPLEDAPDARIIAFRAGDGGIEHLAILVGRPEARAADPDAPAPLARMHSECFTGDLLGSLRCDCGPQLRGAIARMAADGAGVMLYLAQEGRGIGLVNKLRAYALQDSGLDTLDANRALGWGADERNFRVAAAMLEDIGIARVRLLTNNPDKIAALTACGITVEGREAHAFAPNGVNDAYLETKARRFGHLLA